MSYNYCVYHHDLRKTCGHMHHSPKSAMQCMEHLGWQSNRCTISIIDQKKAPTTKKNMVHSPKRKIKSTHLESSKYRVSVDFTIKADAQNQAVEKLEKWLNYARGAEDYVSHIITDIQEVRE